MNHVEWQLPPVELADDDALLRAVAAIYMDSYRRHFADGLNVNPRLPVETRALRRIGPWRLFLLLTPWMLARLLFHDGTAPIDVPAEWSAATRGASDDVGIGPAVSFTLMESAQKAHLNHHPLLGHYALQPLVLAMERYTDADEVFAAWDTVIRTRDENMKRMNKHCPMQKEISRREFLSGGRRRAQD